MAKKQAANYQQMIMEHAKYNAELKAMEYKLNTIVKKTAGNTAQQLGISGNMMSTLMGMGETILNNIKTQHSPLPDDLTTSPFIKNPKLLDTPTNSDVEKYNQRKSELRDNIFKNQLEALRQTRKAKEYNWLGDDKQRSPSKRGGLTGVQK